MSDETLAATPGDGEIVNLDAVSDDQAQADQATVKASDDEKGEAGKAEPDESAPDEDPKPKKLSGSRRERLKNEALLRENAELREIVERNRRPSAGEADDDKEPQEADFNGDYFAYERARAEHVARKTVREEFARRETSKRQNDDRAAMLEHVAAHQEREDEVRELIPDYDKVVAKSGNASLDVQKALLLSDKSALLAYHLSKNPEKLQALNGMTSLELAREIGRLEGSVRMPASKQKTDAPAPASALRGGAAAAFDASSSSMDDYIAKRKAGWNG